MSEEPYDWRAANAPADNPYTEMKGISIRTQLAKELFMHFTDSGRDDIQIARHAIEEGRVSQETATEQMTAHLQMRAQLAVSVADELMYLTIQVPPAKHPDWVKREAQCKQIGVADLTHDERVAMASLWGLHLKNFPKHVMALAEACHKKINDDDCPF